MSKINLRSFETYKLSNGDVTGWLTLTSRRYANDNTPDCAVA